MSLSCLSCRLRSCISCFAFCALSRFCALYSESQLRNIQVANNETSITVIWDKLTTNQKQQFTHVVQSSLKTLATREDILFLFYREGAFQRAEDEQIPLAIAELYTTQMEEWLVHQKNIYLGNGTIEWSFDFQLPLNLKKEKDLRALISGLKTKYDRK